MKDVFLFTFRQNTKGKGFVFSTFIIPLIICVVGIAVTIIAAKPDNPQENVPKNAERLYITNESDMEYVEFKYFGLMECVVGRSVPENDDKAFDVVIMNDGDGYSVKVSAPAWSSLKDDDASAIMPDIIAYVERLGRVNSAKKEAGGMVAGADLMKAYTPVNVNVGTEGDENVNIGTVFFETIGPMIIVAILYMMALIYGQSIGKIVISEKVSKLMETLLITVKPSSLIAGKILAMAFMAVLQMTMWVIGLVSGIGFGHVIAKGINPDYTNYVIEIIKMLRDSGGGLAFSAPVVLMSIAVLYVGFLFLCVFAGLIASPVSKAEEMSSCFGIYQIFIVLGFLAAYFIPMNGDVSPVLDKVLHVVPFTSVFMLPGDILIGRISIALSIVYVIILIAFTVILSLYTGKLYKAQVFYNGVEVNPVKRLFMPLKKKARR
ncbi:MAG: ABC transporter permease [Lachnospiraceae bacterium]|nr:ABC transporter permease [Lachnospiraceae bacterium]